MNSLLLDKVAFVTGGTAGIGKAIALLYAQAGARVVILGTNAERGQLCVEEAKAHTGKESLTFMQVDVSNKEQVDKAIQSTLQQFGKIDILVNNAGITKDGLLMRMFEEDFDRVLEVNLKSAFYTCQAVMKPFMKARSGKIINISSVVG